MSVELDRSAAKRDDQPHESEHDDSGVGMSMLDDSGIDLHKYDMPTVPMNMEFNSAITADVAVS